MVKKSEFFSITIFGRELQFHIHNSCLLMDLSLSLSLSHVIHLWGPISSSSLDHAIGSSTS